MDFKDYYAALGVPKTASDAEIKKAYRKLARKHHPDLNPGDKTAEARFKDINEANEVLGDPEKRRKYDELGANWRMYEQAQREGRPAGGPAQAPFGGGATYRTMTPDEMEALFGDQDPFSDFFHAFLGGAGPAADTRPGRRSRPQARRGRDLEQSVDLTLEEMLSGATRRITIRQADGRERTVDVRIPAGARDGARVRAAGEGEAVTGGGTAGDLYLVVHQLPHARFERKGQDLYVRLPVPVTTAVLGGEVTVPALGGSTLRLKVPELTTTGRVFRLRGHGMPAVGKPQERGDLYATLDIQVPATLTPAEREHYEALRKLEETRTR